MLSRRKRIAFAFFLLIIFIVVIFLALVPGRHSFEAKLLTNRLSFTIDEAESPFLTNILGVSQIQINAKYETPLTFSGRFVGEPFDNESEIEVDLPYTNSQISISFSNSITSEGSEIALTELRLQNQTFIKGLEYPSPLDNLLQLEFKHQESGQSSQLSQLGLDLRGALELTLAGYEIPNLGLSGLDDEPLKIMYTPDIEKFEIPLPVEGSIFITLPDSNTINSEGWFWGGFDVKDVSFTDERRAGQAVDELVLSSIQDGTVRMSNQNLKLEPEQYLIVEDEGVQRIRRIKVIENRGLEVQAVGTTSEIGIGLDPQFPIQKIRSNILSQILSPDAVIAVVSFCSAMIASILSWLVDNLFKPSK